MRFSEVFRESGVLPASLSGDAEFNLLCADSRDLKSGEAFVCLPSPNTDSHAFAAQAVERGAAALIVHDRAAFDEWDGRIPVALVDRSSFEEDLWRIAKHAFGDPSASLRVIGVTGTNGKTTVAWMLREMLIALGVQTAYIGTIGFHAGKVDRTLANTTPHTVDVNRMLLEAKQLGCEVVAMEVSSHALAQHRADGIEFDTAIFTNLTQDHLDFHGDMVAYAESKKRLFFDLGAASSKAFCAAINVDDETGSAWAGELASKVIAFGRRSGDLVFKDIEVAFDRVRIEVRYRGATKKVDAPVGGRYNVDNCASAIAGLLALGYAFDAAASAIESVKPVPGRFELVPNDSGIRVVVDYAHTPDALEKLLSTVGSIGAERVITVFGCGGDRDRTKRPLMAHVVSEHSDLTVVTSDNPRTEDPQAILDEVLEGVAPDAEAVAILDRREAIAYAIRHAEPGDVVVIAGKGHEDYQIIGRTKHPMDDRQLAKEALGARR